MAKEKILITGSTGFLANYLISELNRKGNPEIYGITDEDVPEELKDSTFKVDIRNRDLLFEIVDRIKPDRVFHLAAITNVGFAWKNQKLTYDVNFLGTLNLIEALVKSGLHSIPVVLMSSAEVYGKSNEPITEQTSISIENPYSLSKFAMEMLGDIFIKSNNMNIIKIRAFNFTGPGQDRKFVASDFAYQIAEIEKGKREPVISVGNLSAERDFSDVRDIARYLNIISKKGQSGNTYNLSSGNSLSIENLLNKLLALSNNDIEVKVDKNKFRPVDNPVLKADNSFIEKEFGLVAEYDIDDTLKNILDYWREKKDE